MQKQLIISVGRQFGSAGHVIAKELAKRFDLPYYDSNLLEQVARAKDLDHDELKKYDEQPKNKFFHRTVRGYSSAPEENVAYMQFEYLKTMAKEGKSFVIVGRCSEDILRGTKGLITLFIVSNEEDKIKRVMETDVVSKEKALALMKKEDAKRQNYHDSFCKGKWGDSSNYDLLINSSFLGIEKTTDFLEEYIKTRISIEGASKNFSF